MYAIISNNQVVSYPADPVNENINVSFPPNWSGGTIGNTTYACVQETPQPSVSSLQYVTEGTPSQSNGVWSQTWVTVSYDTNMALKILATKRWQKETGGTTITLGGNSIPISTDATTQMKILGARVAAAANSAYTVNWKMPDGSFVNLDAPTVISISDSIRAHIQSCFDREAVLAGQIHGANSSTMASIDINSGWPV